MAAPNFHIRSCHTGDSASISTLNEQWSYPVSKEAIQIRLEKISALNDRKIFVADLNGTVAGMIYVVSKLPLSALEYAEIEALVVDELFRKQGVGKLLVARAEQWAKEKGLTVLRVRSNTKREEANQFYPKIGFALSKQQNIYERHISVD